LLFNFIYFGKGILAQKKGTYSAPGVERALDIIELLAQESSGLTMSEMTAILDKSYSELFRIVMVLKKRGYLELNSNDDRYFLGQKLNNITPTLPINLISIALPVLEKLAEEIGQSNYLVTYRAGQAVVAMQINSNLSVNFSESLGAKIDMKNSGVAQVFAAFDNDVLNLVEKKDKEFYVLIMQKKSLVVDNYKVQGVKDICSPIFGANNEIKAVLVTPFLTFCDSSNQVPLDEAITKVGDAGKEISFRLGAD
jgi:DNA-binding IclR family transcriptional regulator